MVGIEESLTAPADDEIEITLIGGTSGFGECVLVHLGDGMWIVVDSCVNAKDGSCAPLAYLKEFYSDGEVARHLKYVICTHWHEDHIKGFSELIKVCSSESVLALSCADDREKFVYEMMEKCEYVGSSRKLKELSDSICAANEKGIKIKRVEQDRLIFNVNGVQCFALSPSDMEIKKFNKELADAQLAYHKAMKQVSKLKSIDIGVIEDAEEIEDSIFEKYANLVDEKLEDKQVTGDEVDNLLDYKDAHQIEANDRCVAMLLSFNNHHVILGADLEYDEKKSPEGGWQSVADCECMNGVTANLYKIPHHGSHTGYYDYFVTKFIKPDAVAKLTSWLKGRKSLPKVNMLRKYYGHTKNLYITTTSLLRKKNLEKEKLFRKIMNETTEEIFELKPSLGIIRSRMKKNATVDVWQTDYFGSAKKIEDAYLDTLVND